MSIVLPADNFIITSPRVSWSLADPFADAEKLISSCVRLGTGQLRQTHPWGPL
jgi:hypothetical protein